MEQWVIDVLKDSPAYGAILAIVYLGMKWHERIATQWLAAIDKIDSRNKEASTEFVAAVKDIGEKCHHAHEQVSKMFYEQSVKSNEVMTNVAVNMGHFSRSQEHLSEAVRDLRKQT